MVSGYKKSCYRDSTAVIFDAHSVSTTLLTPSVSGTSSLSFKINGVAIVDSPRVFTVMAGAVSASKSFLSGPGVRGTLVDLPLVIVQAVDSFNNFKTSGGDIVPSEFGPDWLLNYCD